jgi:hypothetical protein
LIQVVIAHLVISNVPSVEEVKMIDEVKMNFSAIIVGVLAALLAPVLVGVAMAAGALLSLIQGVAATARTASKPTNGTDARSGKGAQVVEMPEGRHGVEGFRSAA